jgi:flavin reductase (DIM6/NTAB) family NADH-FMN oxidoreductase RutF
MELSREKTPLDSFYKVLISSIVPRPIAWISTIDKDGNPNLAPYSFFNLVCKNPPTVLFCPGVRGTDGGLKDSYNNVVANREFVVNIVSEELAEAMNISSTEYPADVNEFELAGLTAASSKMVASPRVKESPVSIECKVTEIIEVGKGDIGSGWVVLGEAVYIHIQDRVLLPNFRVDLDELRPIGRLSGPNYTRTKDRFEIIKGKSQLLSE